MIPHRVFLLALLAVGCSSPVAPDPSAFGAQYRIQIAPDPPVIAGQTLTVTLEYGGCGGNHEFELRFRMTSAMSADVWLRKVTPDQPCDMQVIERRSFVLPGSVTAPLSLRLLGPDDLEFGLRP
jgi:hypothetical protein